MDREIFISVTPHAKKRILERAVQKIITDFARQAYLQGKVLTKEETDKVIFNGFTGQYKKRCFLREFKKYIGHTWIFEYSGEDDKTIFHKLITILPD